MSTHTIQASNNEKGNDAKSSKPTSNWLSRISLWLMILCSVAIGLYAFAFQAGMQGDPDTHARFAEWPVFSSMHVIGGASSSSSEDFNFGPSYDATILIFIAGLAEFIWRLCWSVVWMVFCFRQILMVVWLHTLVLACLPCFGCSAVGRPMRVFVAATSHHIKRG